MVSIKRSAVFLAVAAALAAPAYAAPYRVQDAAGKAVQSNPEVQLKWHQFKASLQEREITWGRYLPTLDVIYGVGREHRDSPLYNPAGERRYNFNSSKVTLRENLFEGFATMHDTKRLEHASMVRFYEMLDMSESAAFEATKAYIDVWRFRQLVAFAQENYATHRVIYDKIRDRAESGVGRRVDLETAAGRLALAESNLLTETSNLHDVTARFQRIVGTLPPADMEAPPTALLTKELPKARGDAINRSFEKSPQLKAAFENILSAMRNIKVQQGGYYPRVDAYAEAFHEKNSGGYDGITDGTTYGVTVSWNLFRGFQDQSRERKAAEEKYQALDTREKVCREVRQNTSMAFNDHLRLSEQLQYLDQHQLSSDKAREAFRRQFDIGQRTLLDVLDTENEYYTARRDYLNGENDLAIAQAKYQATSGNLLNVLSLKNLDMTPPNPETTPDEDMLTTCPPEPIALQIPDKETVFMKAKAKEELFRQQNAPAPAPAAKPAAKKAPTKVKKQ